ncbi:SGNH/GDSL hydrolase family protein [Streptomyces griseiscabiei]|uniref:SGNH/GDSL hydrolase family protein n=1 Tax=Streptomyces griseiscabiei TaxID=2993540 RepID=A0ABU4L4B4_9ACTN|nr:SGNH/GDSL hydrolase family protein [Streptomyces griseiscabiei]MBZ3905519.1 SGNH/GDSL hydrolase family protein [Streptomyces griseiscabiei]MDX2910610.1 SGNH/GDSL hydrolase family protein [Streptomyces griseiscabiei]
MGTDTEAGVPADVAAGVVADAAAVELTEGNDPHVLSSAEGAELLRGAPWSRLVIVGDSVAQGISEPRPGYRSEPWSTLVVEALREVRPELVHLGLGQRDLLTAQVRESQLRPALDFKPDLVIALCGGNDGLRKVFDPAAAERELEALFAPLRETGGTLVTSGFFDITGNPHFDARYRDLARERLAALSRITRSVAERLDAVYVDMQTHPTGREESVWSSDGIHLNARGQAVLGTEIIRALAARLTESDR